MNSHKFRHNQKRRFDHGRRNQNDRNPARSDHRDDSSQRRFKPESHKLSFKCLTEAEIGTTEYLTSPEVAINGVIKSRFSDFHVNEIDLAGEEAVLTSLETPTEPVHVVPDFADLEAVKSGVLSVQVLESVKEMLEKPEKSPVDVDVSSLSKEDRSCIHESLKRAFRRSIVAGTVERGERKVIEVKLPDPRKRGTRSDWDWPEQYVHFILYKENIDTVQAISALAQAAKVRAAQFCYAGTKDKRAKTSQWVSVRTMEPERLVSAAKRVNSVRVGNFKFCKEALRLGALKGNRFRIALRQTSTPDDQIETLLADFKEKGFINYFGTQRFGNTAAVPTFEVGKALLKQNFQEACELIMKPRDGDEPKSEEMRKVWWETRDAREARDKIPKWSTCVEAALLDGFIKTNDKDFMGALGHVPRNMRMLYMHSYQSLLWNRAASRRIKELGMEPQEGDLVFVKPETEVLDALEEDEEEPEEKPSAFKSLVRPLTKSELGSFSIYDIVLPLVGHDVAYPGNQVKDWYAEMLAEDGLSVETLKTPHKIYSLAGTYRKLVIRPEEFQWKVQKYEHPDENLILSDLEKLTKKQLPESPEGSHKALVLDFILPPSTYATMALREIMKQDTSPAAQMAVEAENQRNKENAGEEEPEAKKSKSSE